jgi:hypothetical protein
MQGDDTMSNGRKAVMAAVLMGCMGSAAWAHHSFVAEFDPAKPSSIAGNVTKIDWTNPHARFYVDVKDASGTTVNWEVELGSPNTLIRYGWARNTLAAGTAVSVEGFLARDGHKYINAKTVKLADGRTVNAGSSYQGGAQTTKTPGL